MKREFLEAFEVNGAKLSKEAIDSIMAENGKDVEAQKALTAAETQKLTAANNTIKDLQDAAKAFEGVDVGELKGQIRQLQEKYDQDVAKLRLDSALDAALLSSRAKNTKAVRALLNLDEIKLDGDRLLGLDSQLEAVKKEASYLFEDEPGAGGAFSDPAQSGNGTGIRFSSGAQHGGSEPPDYDAMSDEEYYAAVAKRK